jgi:hypothetical protein
MAWKTGSHRDAPQGVLCYGTNNPNEVTWFEADPPDPPETQEADDTKGGAHGGRHHRAEDKAS